MKINRTVQRALQILDCVAKSPNGITLAELAGSLAIPKTSLFDIVTTLAAGHHLRKHDNKFYIGPKAREIGSAYTSRQDLLDVAKPLLTEASEHYNTSSSLVLLNHGRLDYCFQYHPEDAVMIARQGSPYNIMHASGTGKVMLAFMQPDQREEILRDFQLHKFTDRTISSFEALEDELKTVRKNGYALDDREYHYLLQCVAAPILHKGQAVAAVSFSGLNLFNEDPSEMVRRILETAGNISRTYNRE